MPSSTPKRQRFFNDVLRAKDDKSYGGKTIRKVADSMSRKDIEEFVTSVAESKNKKALLAILKDCREPMYLEEGDETSTPINPIAKEFHVKDDFETYVKKYLGQPLSPKELEAINTFKETKPTKIERTEIWYETTDDFKNSTTTVVKKMKDGNQFSFNAFTKHTTAQPEEPETPPMGGPETPTSPETTGAPETATGTAPETEQPMEEEKEDIIVSKSPLFKDEIEGGRILVEFLKKLDL